jgi:hypothetical protein
MFEHNLRLLFPQLERLPHADTLFRLLCRIDVGEIEQAHLALVTQLIRNKKFSRYLINNCYPIGIDGIQKIAFSTRAMASSASRTARAMPFIASPHASSSLTSVWQEYHSLAHEQQDNRMQQHWGERRQHFQCRTPDIPPSTV